MSTKKSVFIFHSFNGNADDGKFVEVDGKKFQSDDGKEPKKDDKGNPIPFAEKKADPAFKVEEADLETLAKINPIVAKFLSEQKTANEAIAKAKAEADKKAEEDATKKGEWQKLAEDRQRKIDELAGDNTKKSDILDKYIGSTKKILAEVLATIPEANKGLIPKDYSPREQLEYIIQNAKLLGAKITESAGGKVPPNDGSPNATEEEKIQNEINELIKKGSTRTEMETQLMIQKSSKLKELQKARIAAQKK